VFVCSESGFLETTFQTFMCLLVIRNVGQQKTLSNQRKIWLDFQESVFLLFWTENTFQKLWKFRNIILFTDYIKFGPQTFDWYIFCLNLFFLISSLKIWFNLIFILTLILIFMIVICFSLIIFLIKIFYLSNLILILLIVTYFIWNNLWNCNYYYFNFIIF
jgi:hypothetical protein